MKILFTICARAGSKGYRNKNVRHLKSIPLVYYTLAAIDLFSAIHVNDEIEIVINTDSSALVRQIESQDIVQNIRFVERKQNLAGDICAKVDVIKDTFLELEKKGCSYDVVVDLDLTSPLRKVSDIEGVINELFNNKNYDLVFSVVRSRRNPYFNMVEKKKDGFYRKVCASRFTARQQANECYELNGSIYAYRPKFLRGNIDKTILDYQCGIYEMDDYRVLDIDYEEDFKVIEALIGYFCCTVEEINVIFEHARVIYESVICLI